MRFTISTLTAIIEIMLTYTTSQPPDQTYCLFGQMFSKNSKVQVPIFFIARTQKLTKNGNITKLPRERNNNLTLTNTTFKPANQMNYILTQSSEKYSKFQTPNHQIINPTTHGLNSAVEMASSISNLTLAPTLFIRATSRARVNDNTLNKQYFVFILVSTFETTITLHQRETNYESNVKHVPVSAKVIRNLGTGEGSTYLTKSISSLTSSHRCPISFRITKELGIELEASEITTAVVSEIISASTIRQRLIVYVVIRSLKHGLIHFTADSGTQLLDPVLKDIEGQDWRSGDQLRLRKISELMTMAQDYLTEPGERIGLNRMQAIEKLDFSLEGFNYMVNCKHGGLSE